ncbi:MAG: tetratricopeptide repeat protein [Acidobacteriota bacterium]
MLLKLAVLFLALFTLDIYAQTAVKRPGRAAVEPTTIARSITDDELTRHLASAQDYQLAGDLDHAAIENRAVIAIALRRVGFLELEQEKFPDAAAHLTTSLTIDDNSMSRASLAVAYMRLARNDEALIQAQSAARLDPQNTRAHQILGSLYYSSGNYEAALAELEQVFNVAPDFDGAYLLGMTYLRLKQSDRAKLLFEEIQETVKNKKADLHILFGQAYEQTEYPTEAEREFNAALVLDPKVLKAHFYKGFVILQHGGSERLAEAAKEFEAELKLTPADFYANFFAGVVASSLGDHKGVLAFLGRAVQANPKSSEAWLFLGQSQMELNDLTGAEKSLRLSVKLSDEASTKSQQIGRTHFLLGRLLLRTGHKAEGESELAKARDVRGQELESDRETIRKMAGEVANADPKVSGARPMQRVTDNRSTAGAPSAEFTKARDQLANILAQAYHNLGVISVQQGDLKNSLENFKAASEWKADFPGLDRNWGIVAFRAEQFEQAAAPLERQLKANPKDDLVRKMLGSIYYLTRDYKRAVATLAPVEITITKDAELAYFYGVSLLQQQMPERAVALFSRLSDQNTTDAQARFYAAQGFVFLGDFARAVKEYAAVATLDPQMNQVHYGAGQALIRMNRLEDAEKEFRHELHLNPTDALSKYHVAFTLLERNIQTDEAEKLLNEAIETRPDYADAHYQLGKLYIQRGHIDDAIRHLEAAVQSDPKKEFIHYQLSIAYRRAKRPDDADRELKIYSDLKAANRRPEPSSRK